jgi:hypothetical protein
MKERKIWKIAEAVAVIIVTSFGSFVLGRVTKKYPDSEKLLKAEAENRVLGRELKRAQMRAESLAHSLGKVTQQLYEKEEGV